MTVKELIEKLKEFDHDLQVCIEHEWEMFVLNGESMRETFYETYLGKDDPWHGRRVLLI